MGSSSSKRRRRRFVWRAAAYVGVALVALVAVGALGYHVFTGWRARDLAGKARENFEQGNFRMAWLQINSAKELRSDDPEVLRAAALIEAGFGRPEALDHLQKLAGQTELTPEDLSARAAAALRHGTDEQFEQAVADLEKADKVSEAGALRAARKLRRGDIDRAIIEARAAVAATGEPASKLNLARLLVQRYRPEFRAGSTPSGAAVAGSAEAVDLVDQLLDTPQRNEVLAFALNEMSSTPENRVRWANAAMENIQTANAALLPAAAVLVRSGQKTPQQIHEQLRPVFDAAPLERRAAYVLWLTGAGMPKEALTMITAQEAGESTAAFGARTEALFGTGNLDAVLGAVESGGNVDDDVRFAAKARAEYGRGRGAQGGSAALREAMHAAAKKGRLEFILPAGESLGASSVVDEKLVELCGDPALADDVFRIARDRFSRSGRASLLGSAFELAQSASPQSASVQDYARYRGLLEGKKADLAETSAACTAEPSNVTFRITHALNLLDHGKSAEALQAFDDITVFADRLPQGQRAVIAAVLHANGENDGAQGVVASIDTDILAPGEYALIVPIRAQLSAQ